MNFSLITIGVQFPHNFLTSTSFAEMDAVVSREGNLAGARYSAVPFFTFVVPYPREKKSRAPQKSKLQFVSHGLAYQALVDGSRDGLLHNAWIASWWLPRRPCGRSAPDADALKHHSIFGVCENDVVKNGMDIGAKMEKIGVRRGSKK